MKRRSRIVSFRLSDEEYNSLKNVSATRGARSVSEFTRSVACGKNEAEMKMEEVLDIMNRRMQSIDQQLQAIIEALKISSNSTQYINEEQGE